MSIHKTVLLKETIDGLNLKDKDAKGLVIVDATFGGGGHSLEVCKRHAGIQIIAFDRDKNVFKGVEDKFKDLGCKISTINSNFSELDKKIINLGVGHLSGEIDGIIFDLGLSSDQLENSGRGFSFLVDEPLLMTMKEKPEKEDTTAFDVVNTWSEESLASIIYGYGEEKFSRKIAKKIVDARQKVSIKTTFDLVKIIESSVPGFYRKGKTHFATKTFQAIRIAVNDELGSLEKGLEKGFKALRVGGRMSVISFHSLEDRVVKKFFKTQEKEEKAILINKRVIVGSEEEIKNNKRARSAKLRVLEKIK